VHDRDESNNANANFRMSGPTTPSTVRIPECTHSEAVRPRTPSAAPPVSPPDASSWGSVICAACDDT
jgi:hypothetical protein